MLAADYRGPRRMRVASKADPVIQHPRDAIVRVTRSCICGSDLHLYNGLVPDTRIGTTFGHEFCGIVEEVGPEVQTLKAGDHVLVPLQGGMAVGDLSRVLQGVIAGIGFLGAGAIIKLGSEREIHGLTTSAGIWMTAAIGVAAGMGREATAVLSTLLALFVLAVLRRVEARISSRHEKRVISSGSE